MEDQDGISSLFVIPVVSFLILIALTIGLLHGETELVLLCLFLLGMAVGGRLWARASLSRIKTSSRVDRDRVFPEERIHVTIEVANEKFLPVWLQTRLSVEGFESDPFSERAWVKESRLLWYQKVRFEGELVAQKRGVYEMGPLHLKAGDPFGFFSQAKKIEGGISVLVYPRIVPVESFRVPSRDLFGIFRTQCAVQDPVYILGTKDYQPWQPSRFIHWKASARHNHLQTKVFEPSAHEKVLFVVHVKSFAKHDAKEEFERTLEGVASLAFRFHHEGYALGLISDGIMQDGREPSVPVRRHCEHLSALFEILARLQMESRGDLLHLVRNRADLKGNTSVVSFAYEEDLSVHEVLSEFETLRRSVILFLSNPSLSREKRRTPSHETHYPLQEVFVR